MDEKARRIRLSVDGVTAEYALNEGFAPNTAQALWDSLPIESTITHAKWAGSAVWFKTMNAPLAGHLVDENEHPVTSLYPGVLVVRPNPSGKGEVFLSYGVAESRYTTGPTWCTPAAQMIGHNKEFLSQLQSTWVDGAKSISVERVEG